MTKLNFNFYFKTYLYILFFYAAFFLFQKYNNNVEWTISEWLINYQGGFTRRGLIGELVYQISNPAGLTIRETIFLFQLVTCGIYFFLIFNLLKKLNKHLILIFAIFSPIFLIYPIAEVEVLARKEIFIFISLLITVAIFSLEKIKNKHYIYFSFILAISCLIWEGVIIFLSYFVFILFVKNKFSFDKKFLIRILFSLLPVFVVFYFIIIFRLSSEDIKIMCNSVGECYGAMTYLNRDISSNINEVVTKFQITYLIRYLLIFFLGFFPLVILITNSTFTFGKIYQNKNTVLFSFTLIFLPSISFYYIAQDWGRWINISYVFTLITYIYCLKNKLITLNTMNMNYSILKNKYITIILFIIFCFGWSPKTLINEDVSSIPMYRKSLNIIKSIY